METAGPLWKNQEMEDTLGFLQEGLREANNPRGIHRLLSRLKRVTCPTHAMFCSLSVPPRAQFEAWMYVLTWTTITLELPRRSYEHPVSSAPSLGSSRATRNDPDKPPRDPRSPNKHALAKGGRTCRLLLNTRAVQNRRGCSILLHVS